MENFSKPIGKTDDECKQFIIDSLQGDATHGFDVDSIYYCNGTWCIFEYLKCDSDAVSPYTSDPKYYPWNWKKFYSLYCLARQLNGRLFLVNYSTRPRDRDQVKLMEVLSFDHEKAKAFVSKVTPTPYVYMELRHRKMTRASFSEYLRELNQAASTPE